MRNFKSAHRIAITTGTLLSAAALWFLPCVSRADTYNAAADFSATSNPTGAWSYGFETYSAGVPNPATFTLYDTSNPQAITGGTLDLWESSTVGGVDPNVTHNGTANTLSCCGGNNITWSPGEMSIGPLGSPLQATVVRWTAPVSGGYNINVSFLDNQDGGDGADVYLFQNATALYTGNAGTTVNAGVTVPTLSLNLVAGDKIDFIVGPGADLNPTGNHTQLLATIMSIPEPSTLALLALGVLGITWLRRRRS